MGIPIVDASRVDIALLIFGSYTAFVAWVVLFNGAEVLEGTMKSAFVIASDAIWWSATGIRIYAGLIWVGSVLRLAFIYGW